MRFADINMGILGARFALRDKYECTIHDPGSPLAEELWSSLSKVEPGLYGGSLHATDSPDVLFGYLSHKDLLAWLRPNFDSKINGMVSAAAQLRPQALVLVSTKSAVKVQKGYPFLQLLATLARNDYETHWFTASAKAFGLPHDAHYTLLVSVLAGDSQLCARSIAKSIGTDLGDLYENLGEIECQLEERRPRLGASRRQVTSLPSAGFTSRGALSGTRNRYLKLKRKPNINLQEIVCSGGDRLRPKPVRLVSRHGISGCAFKDEATSYALGPGTSAYPLFAFEQAQLEGRDVFDYAPYSNWSTVRDDHAIVRLEPSRAVLLHGSEAWPWQRLLYRANRALGSKYALISAGFPPSMLQQVADVMSSYLRGVH